MLSFVIPVFNEEESLNHFYKELQKLIIELKDKCETIFIDDGSTDNSLNILKQLASDDNMIKIYSFRRNLGKAEALTLGFEKANGDYIITLDADLQDQPSQVVKLLNKARSGYDLVCGWRRYRKDKSKMKVISRLFNFFMSAFFNLAVHDYNCGLKVYSREVVRDLKLYGGLHRFIPVLVSEKGFAVTELAVEHSPRVYGKSKYGFSKLWSDLPDMLTIIFLVKYSKRPMHFFGIAGGFLIFTGFIVLIYLSYLRFMGETVGNRPLLFFGMLLVLAGFQIFFTGFLADLIINISHSRMDEKINSFPLKYSSDKN